MKAISLKQPWANLIAHGKKSIETRTWATKHRGDILICSSMNADKNLVSDWPLEPKGCAIAVATLVNCRPMTKDDEVNACCELYPRAHAWVLENVRRIEPIPLKGALGLFEAGLEWADMKVIEEAQ